MPPCQQGKSILTLCGPFAGTMDGTALIEMLRSMSQAGYSSNPSNGNGPVAHHQQQQGESASDAVPIAAPCIPQQPASMAPAQPDASPAPAEVQHAEAEPAQHSVPQLIDTPIAAQMESHPLPQAALEAQREQYSSEVCKPADWSMLSGLQMPKAEQPAEPTSAAPPQQGDGTAAQLQQQQQAANAPSVPEAAAAPQLVPEAQAPTGQYDIAEPSSTLSEQPGMPDGAGAMAGPAAAISVQQAEDAALMQPSQVYTESPGDAGDLQDGQDTSMPDAEVENALPGQAAASELRAAAQPALPAAANQAQGGALPAVEHLVMHGSTEVDQAPLQQAAPGFTAGAEHVAGPHPAPAESLEEEEVTEVHDDSAPDQAQLGCPADSAAAAHPAADAGDAPALLGSKADVSMAILKNDAAAADHGRVATAPEHQTLQDNGEATGIKGAAPSLQDHETTAIQAAKTGANPGSDAVPVPDARVSEDGDH